MEPNLKSCSRNTNSLNESKKSYLPVAKTISVGLDIHQGEVPNTNKKIMVRHNFWIFFSASFILKLFSISGTISQIDESTDR